MEINDLVDSHLTPDTYSEQRIYVVTLKKEAGRYTARENVNVNLIKCLITEFNGSQGYSNISKSDIVFKDRLEDSEFYIYDTYIDFGESEIVNCRGEFYNCWITGKIKISDNSKITFKKCYFVNAFVEVLNSECIVNGIHKEKYKIGYYDKEIPEGDTQLSGGQVDPADNYVKIFKVIENSKINISNIKKVDAIDCFVYVDNGLAEIINTSVLNGSGNSSDIAVIHCKNGKLFMRNCGGILATANSSVICENSQIDIDRPGSIITNSGKACYMNKCQVKMRNIGGLYTENGDMNLVLENSTFDIYGIGMGEFTKTIMITKSNGRIDMIDTFFTNGEGFKVEDSIVSVKKVSKVKVGKDFIFLVNSTMSINDIDEYISALPECFCNVDASTLLGRDLGYISAISKSLVKCKNSKVELEDINFGMISEYLVSADTSNVKLYKITGSSNYGIQDIESEVYLVENIITFLSSPLIDGEEDTIKVKNSQLTANSGIITLNNSLLLELTNSEVKCSEISNSQVEKLHLWKSTLEAISGDIIFSSIPEVIFEESIFKASGSISMSGTELIGKYSTIIGASSSISGNSIVLNNSSWTGDIELSGCEIRIRDNNFNGDLSIGNSNIISFKNVGSGELNLTSCSYDSSMDNWSATTIENCSITAFKTGFGSCIANGSNGLRLSICNVGNITIADTLQLDSINSSLGSISGGIIIGIIIGGSSSISSTGTLVLIGGSNLYSGSGKIISVGNSVSGEGNMIVVGDTIPSGAYGIEVNSRVLMQYVNSLPFVEVNSDIITLKVDNNTYIEISGSSQSIVLKVIGGRIDNYTS